MLYSTSWDYQACTRDTLWCQHYVMTSKEYLINCHILWQYFELVFLQLQLLKMLCKLLIVWVNYEKKTKKGSLFMKHCVDVQSSAKTPMLLVATGSSVSASIRLHRPWDDWNEFWLKYCMGRQFVSNMELTQKDLKLVPYELTLCVTHGYDT